ncbi:MAG: hypothetical protein COV08_00895 [Candidatus Vogelbacteria bacterium CG10_big_fil_rev_8_21_14_0_10_49_38]|uniref:Uncharacterized protein n=1 Tax=Candidatus Vogelbacteria bacterium CG10_big_fil_rev_8_21_14_0_10_49_38 TaxID=1975043 RepID=A0A2H0RIB4_9BACT|nr:MAG: hypothetical protein BK006_00900 [bacterium CG10_49_38]PIR46233.1 MAG: hypothetical protein COV08_00895 [Candidatus Vogelbacteria bacterium CG10_big_fil_rev_8_21_14_0_10_49_38]
MLLGIKSRKILFWRHALVGSLAGLLVALFSWSRPELPFDVALWRALGDAGFVFLFVTLSLGPLSRLGTPALRLLTWRRETGIWFALLVLTHSLRVSGFALSEPGLALPNLLGLGALTWALILMATSSDRAVDYLGISSWKWLHQGAYVIFYLASLHGGYHLFLRYPNTPNWFRWPFAVMVIGILVLQTAAFIKTVRQQRIKAW